MYATAVMMRWHNCASEMRGQSTELAEHRLNNVTMLPDKTLPLRVNSQSKEFVGDRESASRVPQARRYNGV
jgi:hypothetical protein